MVNQARFVGVRYAFVLAALALMSGCWETLPTVPSSPQEVKVPVPVDTPEPPVFTKPALPIGNLTEASKAHPDEVVKAFAATIELLKGEVKARDVALDAYRKAP